MSVPIVARARRPPGRTSLAARHSIGPAAAVAVALVGACAMVGFAVARGRTANDLAFALTGATGVCAIWAVGGFDGLTSCALAAVPWLVVFGNVAPRLTLTIGCGVSALLLVSRGPASRAIPSLAWAGILLFAGMLVAELAAVYSSAAMTEAAKDLLFPAMVFAACTDTTRRWLVSRRRLLIASGLAALTVQLVAAVLHVGPAGVYASAGTYANTGASLGLVSDAPHEMALVGIVIAAACLLTVKDLRWRVGTATLAALPALLSGVRSAAVAVILVIVVLALGARGQRGMRLSIVATCVIIAVSGAGSVVTERIANGASTGEFSNFASAGSGRGGLTTAVLSKVESSDVGGLLFGHGVGTDAVTINQTLGLSVGVQDDLLAILVDLGLVGLVGWLCLWLALLRSRLEWRILLPLASYAVTNGVLQYVGGVVFAIALAAACSQDMGSADRRPVGLA